MKTTIILNGPPGVGKDVIAKMLVKYHNFTKQEFKTSLYEKTAEYYQVDLKEFIKLATNRDQKESLTNFFGRSFRITPREALIHVSEKVCKPKHGKDYFGVLAAKEIKEGLNVFSDGGGWYEELKPVADVSDKVFIFKLIRENFNFDNDSRNYFGKVPKELKNKIISYDLALLENNPDEAVKDIMFLIQLNGVKSY